MTNIPLWWVSALAALLLALIHIQASKLRFLKRKPRSRWLSLGSGVSVAYVFVHVLPDLSAAQENFQNQVTLLAAVEHHLYVMALLGLLAFYGLEQAAKTSRQQNRKEGKGDATQPAVFWLHMTSFALYNALIGYLLMHREEPGAGNLMIYVIAMALHFVVNDYSLSEDHKAAYEKKGRWILASAVVCGWIVGSQIDITTAATATLFAFLAGSIVLNVLKEELPEAKESRFGTFFLGALGYTGLLLLLG